MIRCKYAVRVPFREIVGTTRSKDDPIGIAVTSEEAARQYVKSGGIGYTHSYIKVRVFETAKEGLAWKKDN